MSFGALALVLGAGLLGPALAGGSAYRAPLLVGELAAGLLIGTGGLGWVDPAHPPLAFLGEIGFAVLMLIAGTHLPLRTPGLRGALRQGLLATALTFALALPVAVLLAHVTSLHRPGILLVLLATSSAAVVIPVLSDDGTGPAAGALVAVTWVSIADVASVVAVPIVLAEGSVVRVVAGGLLILAGAAAVYVVAKYVIRRELLDGPARASVTRGWALRLRFWLVVLFTLAWVATQFHTSVLIAGFSLGAVISLLGEPRTVAQELIGVGEGFFVPLFFVLLGARLDAGAMFSNAGDIGLLVSLVAGTVAVHLVVAAVVGAGRDTGLLAAAQLGVPAAVASVGLGTGALDPGQAAAIVGAAVVTVAVAALGAAGLRRKAAAAAA